MYTRRVTCLTAVLFLSLTGLVLADGGVTFQNVAADGGAGITYQRVPSLRRALFEDIIDDVIASPPTIGSFFGTTRPNSPQKAAGAPGVAIFDYDNDGDLDVYVTNGPGADNSLYSNQLVETGELAFVDVGGPAGVGAYNLDSSGVCFGDLDNDGDEDLYVLSTAGQNQLFENLGDGTFQNVTVSAGVGGDSRNAVACTIADFNGDTLLDIVVGNSYDNWNHRLPVFITGPTYSGMEHNQLFINQGGNVFADESAASGIENVSNMSGPNLTGAAFTWAIASADYDQDGDVDILSLDNQGGSSLGEKQYERGYLRLYQNDGTAHFTEVTEAAGLDIWGGWMGSDFGDLNCDGNLDFFATDLGNYLGSPTASSRWFLGAADGTFTVPGVGDLVKTPFGWGASIFDYDNDGDADIVYHGGIDLLSLELTDNPGVILRNEGICTAIFTWDSGATASHLFRSVQGVAVGDLNQDGFEDIVTVADTVIKSSHFTQFAPGGPSPFDAVAGLERLFAFTQDPDQVTYVAEPDTLSGGDLWIEVSSADNGNGWAEVTALGSAGILDPDDFAGLVNRDGIGAVAYFRPNGGKQSIRPIIGGSSYASQDALPANFGLGTAPKGQLEILWPGGDRNRLYSVRAGDRVVFPHIPCSYDTDLSEGDYKSCVKDSTRQYKRAGFITAQHRTRLINSALRAYRDFHKGL